MNKNELVAVIAMKTNMKKSKTLEIVNTITEIISSELASGNNVSLNNFGSFRVIERKERNGKHPQTGESLIIPAKSIVKFKPGKNMKNI